MQNYYRGTKELVPANENIPEYPPSNTYPTKKPTPTAGSPVHFTAYPDYRSDSYKEEYKGNYVPCTGWLGQTLDAAEPLAQVYRGIPNGTLVAVVLIKL